VVIVGKKILANIISEGIIMLYSEFKPTVFDYNIDIDRANWRIVPVGRNRDANELSESNFAVAVDMLGGESETVEIHRFGHWTNGWFEILIVDSEDSEKITIVDDIERSLENYPILDEMDFYQREWDSAVECWEIYGYSDFVSGICKQFNLSEDIDEFLNTLDSNVIWNFYVDCTDRMYESDSGGVYLPIDDALSGIDEGEILELLEPYIDQILKDFHLRVLATGTPDLFGDLDRLYWEGISPSFDLDDLEEMELKIGG
jgi:hypothetical protein